MNFRLYAPAQRKNPATYWLRFWVSPRANQDGFCRRKENVLSLLERIEGSGTYSYSCTDMYFTYFVASGHAEKGFLGQAVCETARWLLRLSLATVVFLFVSMGVRSKPRMYLSLAGLLYSPLWTFQLWPPDASAPTDAFRTLAAEVGTYGRRMRTDNLA
jgi:hypothetical protein